MRYKSRPIKFTILTYTVQGVFVYSQGGLIVPLQFPIFFIIPKRNLIHISTHCFPQATSKLVSYHRFIYSGQFISIESYNKESFVYGFFNWADLQSLSILYCIMHQYFISFYCWMIFHCMDIPHFLYSSFRYLCCFYVWLLWIM